MNTPATKNDIRNLYDQSPAAIRTYLEQLPRLLDDYPLDVALAYVFAQVELAHNMTLYCAVVKMHKANATLARNAIDVHHMTREGFATRFETVLGKPLPSEIKGTLESAEVVRDKVMHGKTTTGKEKREALANVLSYAEKFNDFVSSIAGFRPFGKLVGFKGSGKSLEKSTTRWMLKGMGFGLS